MNNIKNTQIRKSNDKLTSLPVVEIIHYDTNEMQSQKETFPVSHFLDSECKKLKSTKNFN